MVITLRGFIMDEFGVGPDTAAEDVAATDVAGTTTGWSTIKIT